MTSAPPRVCDLSPSNALVRVSGDDAAEFLHNQFTNDVKALAVGAAQWNGWCTPKGRLLATFVLARDAEGFLLMLPAEFAEAFAKRLRMFVLRAKAKVEDVSAAMPRFGLWDGAIPAGAFRLGDSRAVAFGKAPEGRAATLEEWALSLIRDGVVQVVPGTQEAFVPQMANYELVGGVSFKKGCYPGQEIVARTQYRGILKKRAVRVRSAAPLAPGDSVYSEAFGDQSAGTVANVAPSPGGGFEALVVAQLEAIEKKSLRLGSLAGPALDIQPLPYPF
ncbi:MAG: folate-binding protein [Betaproteobacteria bacterium]|nr:folate-binding protein [Betaproteobacteria bacterium]